MSKTMFKNAARMALAHYPIGEYTLHFLAHGENVTYRVANARGEVFLLRLHRSVSNVFGQKWLKPDVIRSECVWLDALRGGTGLVLQEPVYNRFGDFVTEVKDGDGRPLLSTLLRWVEGSHIKDYSEGWAERLGVLVGRMQLFARDWRAPDGFVRRRWDWDRFWSQLDDLRKGVKLGTVSDAQYKAYEAALKQLRLVMNNLGETPELWGMIHADLHRDNFLIFGDEIRPIDFSLCGFGYYLYEAADTMRYIDPEFYPAFMHGYQQHMTLHKNHQQILKAFFIAGAISNQAFLALNPIDFDHLSKGVKEKPDYVDPRVLKFLDGESFLEF